MDEQRADIFIPPASGDTANNVDTAPNTPTTGGQSDPTLVTGQDPDSVAGIPISYDTGAGGTPAPGGQSDLTGDPTMQPNQYPDKEPISGVALGGTGAPGSQGITPAGPFEGGTTIQVTNPSLQGAPANGQSGTQMETVQLDIAGPNDSTATASNYPPKTPILDGDFYPTPGSPTNATGPGSDGHVMVGGWKKGQRGDGGEGAEFRGFQGATTFPGGESGGVTGGPVAAARMPAPPANPVNTSDAGDVVRPQPTDPGGTKNGAWAKTADYPFLPIPAGDGPWKQT